MGNKPYTRSFCVFVSILLIALIVISMKPRSIQPLHRFSQMIVENRKINTQTSNQSSFVLTRISNVTLIHSNKTLETTIQCIGSLYNQTCLYHNLYYVDQTFMILTVKGTVLPNFVVRTNAFAIRPTIPNRREFDSYLDLEQFVRDKIDPMILPSTTVYFGQHWHHNIGHALFDGLYPAYLSLIRFAPRHLQAFRILVQLDDCLDCWSEDVYSRFAGLGILKQSVLNQFSRGRWFVFEELIMSNAMSCQRCIQPNFQLAGSIEYDAARLFRDRMYRQHGLHLPAARLKNSAEYRSSRDILYAFVIDNKRFTLNDRDEIRNAMKELNDYTDKNYRARRDNQTTLVWPLIRVYYLDYSRVRALTRNAIQVKTTAIDSRSPSYELKENNFIAQLKTLRKMDIHVAGPGTGQMYQTFLSDGSVHVNLGGIRPVKFTDNEQLYASFLEQYMTSGTPYIKGLYYPIKERPHGIKKDQVIKLIRQAGQTIQQGFSLPVNPQENLAADGQLFTEMCVKDPQFCDLITVRSYEKPFLCVDFWVEDFVHEYGQWSVNGTLVNGHRISCPFNHTLLHQLRQKYSIDHRPIHWSESLFQQISPWLKGFI